MAKLISTAISKTKENEKRIFTFQIDEHEIRYILHCMISNDILNSYIDGDLWKDLNTILEKGNG